MKYIATTSLSSTPETAWREAVNLCKAIDRGVNDTIELKSFVTFVPEAETDDGKTVIEFTCNSRLFRVNARTSSLPPNQPVRANRKTRAKQKNGR